MRAVQVAVMTTLVALFFLTPAWGAETKIGVIDFQKVLKESKAGKKAKEQIEKKGKSFEKTLKSKGEEIEKLKKKLEAESMVMSKEKRESKERDFKIKVMDFKDLQKRYAKEFKKFEAEVIKRIQKEVFELVRTIGEKGGYTLIVEKGAVLYFPDTVNVTDQLIKLYDKK